MTREEALTLWLPVIKMGVESMQECNEALDMAIKALERTPRKGEWLKMSNEQEDHRYQCSRCGNVVHYKDKINLYTFNSWCGRCGSDNRRN